MIIANLWRTIQRMSPATTLLYNVIPCDRYIQLDNIGVCKLTFTPVALLSKGPIIYLHYSPD